MHGMLDQGRFNRLLGYQIAGMGSRRGNRPIMVRSCYGAGFAECKEDREPAHVVLDVSDLSRSLPLPAISLIIPGDILWLAIARR